MFFSATEGSSTFVAHDAKCRALNGYNATAERPLKASGKSDTLDMSQTSFAVPNTDGSALFITINTAKIKYT